MFFKSTNIKRIFDCIVLSTFIFSQVCGVTPVLAQSTLNLPQPGVMVSTSPPFIPPMLKGLIVHPENPFQFDFVLDSGDANLSDDEINKQSAKLIKYFLASLTMPENELWVNLSPYEDNRIIPDEFGKTEMGQALLAQDYLLKQLTASLLYPEEDLGKSFWDKVYQKANERYGTSEIPVNTFNKVWIVPDKALIHENGDRAFIVESHLKVMLEEDYLATKKNYENQQVGTDQLDKNKVNQLSAVSSNVIREIIIPEIEKEVNNGQQFALLRQIYHSFILASWYKKNLRQSVLNQAYSNKKKIAGLETEEKNAKEIIYRQYIQAFEKGVYDFIKEDYDESTRQVVPRKYFSGGLELKDPSQLTQREFVPDGKVYRIEGGFSDTASASRKDTPEGSPAEALTDLFEHREELKENPITVQSTRNLADGGIRWRRINDKRNEPFSESTIRSELNMLSQLGFLTKRSYKKRVEKGKIISEYQYFLTDWVRNITSEQLEQVLLLDGFNLARIPALKVSAIREKLEEILPQKRKSILQARRLIETLKELLKKVNSGKSLTKFEQEELKSIFLEYGFAYIANRDSVDSEIWIDGLLFIVSRFESDKYTKYREQEADDEKAKLNQHIMSQLSNRSTAHEASHFAYPYVNVSYRFMRHAGQFGDAREEMQTLMSQYANNVSDNFSLRGILENFDVFESSTMASFVLAEFKRHLEESRLFAKGVLELAKKYPHLEQLLKDELENCKSAIGEIIFLEMTIQDWEEKKTGDFGDTTAMYYEIKDIVSLLGLNLGRKIGLEFKDFDYRVYMRFSKYDLYNILKVFIDNSVQSASKKKDLRVGVVVSSRESEKGSIMEIVIQDNGKGMTEEQVDKVRRGEKFTTKGKFGSGQGLEAVRALISKYSGTMEVESEQDVGTTFKLSFPVDNAMLNDPEKPGGIDFNPNYLDIQTQGNRINLPLPESSEEMQGIEINGLVPFIINITPITNIPVLIGESEAGKDKSLIKVN